VDAGAVIVGSPATVRERLGGILQRFHIGNLHVMLQFGSMPRQLAMDNLGLFAAEVLPALHDFRAREAWEHHWWPERLGGRPLADAGLRSAGAAR